MRSESRAKVGLPARTLNGKEALLERWRAQLPENSDSRSMHPTSVVRCARLNSVPECTASVPECTAAVQRDTDRVRVRG